MNYVTRKIISFDKTMPFGHLVKLIRKSKGMSYDDLRKRLSENRSMLHNVAALEAKGSAPFKLQDLYTLAKSLGDDSDDVNHIFNLLVKHRYGEKFTVIVKEQHEL